jgi:cysteine desulfurase family protein
MQRRYLDNAATSWPKPEEVYQAVDDCQRQLGVSVGRATTRRGQEMQAIVDRARRGIATLLNAESPRTIVFAFNGTDALNLAIHGWLAPGDHVITSAAEHNSILRPLRAAQDRLPIAIDYAPVDGAGRIDPDAIRSLIRPRTRLIALTHASNVTGAIQPVEAVARIAQDAEIPFLIDAAQSAGHVPIDLKTLPADFVAFSGHKGLLGPLGTGALYIRSGRERELRPIREGGTGSVSEREAMPEELPDRFEAGNHNAPGLAGLAAGVEWILKRSVAALREHEIALTTRLLERLEDIRGVTVYGPGAGDERVGVVSILCAGFDPQSLAAVLDDSFGIETRAGLHCAPRLHRALGTLSEGGLTRLSVGPFTTAEEIDATTEALATICESTLKS